MHLSITWSFLQSRKAPKTTTATGPKEEDAVELDTWTQDSDQEVINKCPDFVYSTVKENVAVECAVCLSEFEECDMVKIQPKCEHIFQQHCIDVWSSSHINCPICQR
ncbi:E3 ubiquitin-protein ligase ATL31 [Glycine max]|uniref:RING-type E3 ubiquitin transferase n=1 Tax=Glycine max TaxID=3847 RepID=A0A0R0JKU0_SOYBN|nr:hypothetical protein GYH30_014832 [Glycine max]KAH1245416.1 E3 ubiquitin-protein ligase ATL31 [Glycine max]